MARLGCGSDWASSGAARHWDCLVTELNKCTEQRHTVEGVGGPWELFHPIPLEVLPSHVERGMAFMEAHPPACRSSGHRHHLQPEYQTLPHGHSTWLKLRFSPQADFCHPRPLGSFANVAA